MAALALLVAQAGGRQDGPFLWILVGVALGLLLGFVYAAVRRALGRGRRR